ncbi:MAG: DMT family transporter, partial [Armatimonadetes bacterium]|nr:DMT family transporter [Armatimonadota bacterium]
LIESSVWVGIAFLALAVLATSAFMWIMKLSQERGYSVLAVGGANYLTAAAVAVPLTSVHDLHAVPLGLWLVAGASGVGFVLTYLLLIPALRYHGVAIPTAAVQVSMVVPVFLASLLWHERLGPVQALGVAVSVLAIVLLVPPSGERVESLSRWGWLLVPGIFALSGGTRAAQKMITVLAAGPGQSALALIWFGAAAVFSIGLMARTGWPTRRGEWLTGVCLGVVNLGCMVCLLRALSEIPATIVFPALSCLSLTLTTAGAFLFWKERPTRRVGLGIVIGLLAVLLVGAH